MIQLHWEYINYYCDIIVDQLDKKYDAVYGVPRGGLVPAVIISHKLGIPLTDLRGGDDPMGCNTLVVDDINDTGKTVNEYKAVGLDIAVLIERKTSAGSADFAGVIVDYDDWIVFPWESRERAEADEKAYLESRGINAR